MCMDIILFDNLHYSWSRPFRVAAYSSPLRCSILSVFVVREFQLCIGVNPLNAELNTICHLLVLLGAYHILHISRIRVNTMLCTRSNWRRRCKCVFLHLAHTSKRHGVHCASNFFKSSEPTGIGWRQLWDKIMYI